MDLSPRGLADHGLQQEPKKRVYHPLQVQKAYRSLLLYLMKK